MDDKQWLTVSFLSCVVALLAFVELTGSFITLQRILFLETTAAIPGMVAGGGPESGRDLFCHIAHPLLLSSSQLSDTFTA